LRKEFNNRLRKKKNDTEKNSECSINTLLSETLGGMSSDKIKALVASGSPAKKTRDSQVTTFVVAFEGNQVP
jgi:hypothetical protein